MSDLMSKSRNESGWAVGGVVFAATMMMMTGVFQFIEGLAAILNDEFFIDVEGYSFSLDLTAWGWIHLIIGVLVAVSGFFLFAAKRFAAIAAIALAGLSAVSNFFFIPYYPFWSIVTIALAVYVIWAVARTGLLES